jgi:trk system potassium uptake protein TrkH
MKTKFSTGKWKITKSQIIVIGFLSLILFGSVLLMLPVAAKNGNGTPFIDALFTATTATCVTGLVVHDTFSYWSIFGQLVILCLIQVGGLGFMTLATLFSLAVRRKISYNERLLISESLGKDSAQGVVSLTQHLLVGTLAIESAGVLILAVKFIPTMGFGTGLYYAVFHSISAFCNAGIDLMGQFAPYSSLTAYADDWVVNLTIMSLIIIGGLGFMVWENIYRSKSFRDLSVHTKLVLTITIFLIVIGTLLILQFEHDNPRTLGDKPWDEKILSSLFQSVTCRTAGFNTIDLAQMRNASIIVMTILMFIGGAPGSTAGGVKVTVIGILFLTILSTMRGNDDVNIMEKRLGKNTVFRAMMVFIIAMVILCTGTLLLCAFEDISIRESVFEVASALGTVGLSLGMTPTFGMPAKIMLILIMFMGRVGVFTMAVSISLKNNKAQPKIRYPEDRIMI